MSSVVDVVTNPDRFFDEEKRDPSFLWPALIVLGVGVISLLGSIPLLTKFSQVGGMGSFVAIVSVVGGVFGLVFNFVFWAIWTGLFYVVTILFDGEGSFKTLFALVGWGYVPKLFDAIAGSAISYTVFSGASLPSDPRLLATTMQSLRTGPLFTLATVLTVVFLLWSGFIWTYAVKHARNVTQRQAAITVGIFVAVRLLMIAAGSLL